MKTKCYLSTICYSPVEHIKKQLDKYVECNRLDFYMLIPHKAEEDEKKDHVHLFIWPSVPIDTRDLDIDLMVDNGDGQTLGTCKIWHTVGKNNISDWILYVLHDVMYMRIKGYTERKYTYKDEDMISSSEDGKNTLIYDAYHTSTFTFNRRVLDLILKSKDIKETGKDLVLNGYIPLNSTCSFHHLLQILQGG